MKTLLTFFISFLICSEALAQAPVIQWQKTLGVSGNFQNQANAMDQTGDGGYVLAGYAEDLVSGATDYFIAKLSSTGKILWQKTYGGTGNDAANSIRSTPDGGAIVVGASASNDGDVSGNHGSLDDWIIKINSLGEIEWQRSYGGSRDDLGNSIQLTSDGGYIVVGLSDSKDGDVGSNGKQSAWVMKIDSKGNILWQRSYGGKSYVQANDIKLTKDKGYIIAGLAGVTTLQGPNFWVSKIDSGGTTQWQNTYGGKKDDEATCVQTTTDGGYILTGFSYSRDKDFINNHGGADYLIIKVDSNGTRQWQRLLGSTVDDKPYSIIVTHDDSYIVAGYSGANDGDVTGSHGDGDIWVIKLDTLGTVLWKKTYEGSNGELARAIQVTADGGYVMAGVTASNDGDITGTLSGVQDCWVVKLSQDGLPVTFSSFSAQKQKTSVFLQWQTATEQNSSLFNIQRSIDGAHFTTIGSTKAAGNSAALLNYSYTDVSASAANASTLYYRIEEADADGRKTYTSTAKISYNNNSLAFTLVPNPVHNAIRFTANKDVAAATIRVATINGKIVYSATKHIYASIINEIPVARLAAGVYMLTIEAEGGRTSLKVVKE